MKIRYFWDSSRCGDVEKKVLELLEDIEAVEVRDTCEWGNERVRKFYLDEVMPIVSDGEPSLLRTEVESGEEVNALQAGLSILGLGVLISDDSIYIGDEALDFVESL